MALGIALVVGLVTFFAAYWGSYILMGFEGGDTAMWVGAFCAVLVGWFVYSSVSPGNLVWRMFRMGFIVGGIGFALGFFGPMVFTPEANQGPLLGIFITGPGGFLLGCAYGLVEGLVTSRSEG